MRTKELIDHLIAMNFRVFPQPNFMPDLEESQLPALFVMGAAGSEADRDLPIEYPAFQIIVKGKNFQDNPGQMDKTEQLSKELINKLRTEKQIIIGGNLVYYIRARQSEPIPIGIDTKERPTFSTNFYMKVQPIKE